jgi:hypothetical protein
MVILEGLWVNKPIDIPNIDGNVIVLISVSSQILSLCLEHNDIFPYGIVVCGVEGPNFHDLDLLVFDSDNVKHFEFSISIIHHDVIIDFPFQQILITRKMEDLEFKPRSCP